MFYNSILTLPRVSVRSHKLEDRISNQTARILVASHMQGPLDSHTSDLAANLRIPTIPTLGLIVHYNDSLNSLKCFTFNYSFIIKDTTQEQPSKRDA